MTVTIFGQVETINGISAWHRNDGSVARTTITDAFDMALPPLGLPLDLGHEPGSIAGEFVYLERRGQELLGVAVIQDDPALERALLGTSTPLFFSPDTRHRGTAAELTARHSHSQSARLVSVGLVASTARLAATPVRMLPGDIRREADRSRLPRSAWATTPLLARAAEVPLGRHPTRIAEPLSTDDVLLLDGPGGRLAVHRTSGEAVGLVTRRSTAPPRGWDDQPPAGCGPMEHRRGGRILAVR